MVTEWKQFVNNAGSELTATLTNTATSFSVPTGEGGFFPAAGPFWVTVFGTTVAEGHEIILVGSISGDTMSSCLRGQQGTSAAQWPTGSNVQLLWTAGGVDQIQEAITALEEGTTLTDLSYSQAVKIRKAGTGVNPTLTLIHSRGSISSPTASQSTDPSGSVLFQAYTSTAAVSVAEIVALPDGQIPATGDAPGMMEFRVTPNSSATPEVALTLYNDKSATAGASEIQVWDATGYVPTAAIKTGTTNDGKVLAAGATEASAAFATLATLLSVTGNAGKHLYTDGSSLSWTQVIPDQATHSGEYLTTDGSVVSWAAAAGGSPGADSIGASEMKETEEITLLGLLTLEASTGDIDSLQLRHCRTSTTSPTNSGSGDGTGITFEFYEGSSWRVGARIKADVAGTPSSDMPTNLGFWVCKDGAVSPPADAAVTIGQSQHVAIGDTDFSAAWFTVKGPSGTNIPVVRIEQSDNDEPFIQFQGTSAADDTKNISTSAIGTYTGRIRININNTDYWIPYYTPA